MKIEIELSDIESLKKHLACEKERVIELEQKIKDLSEDELKKKAVNLSKRLFDNYMGCVFRELGFEKWEEGNVHFGDNLAHWLGKYWWDSERLDINIGADISTKFRKAYLSLGIKPEGEIEENEDDAYKLI